MVHSGTLYLRDSSSGGSSNSKVNVISSGQQCKIYTLPIAIQQAVTSAATAGLLVTAAAIAWLRLTGPASARPLNHASAGASEQQQAVGQQAHAHTQATAARSAAATATAAEGRMGAQAAGGGTAGRAAAAAVVAAGDSSLKQRRAKAQAALAAAGAEGRLGTVVVEGEEEGVLDGLDEDVDVGVEGESEEEREGEGGKEGLTSAYRRWSAQPVACNVPLRVVAVRGAVPSIWRKVGGGTGGREGWLG